MNKACVIALLAALAWPLAHAEAMLGVWETVNDRTGQVESLVRITEHDGVLEGTVEKVYSPPAESSNPICDACQGEYKNKPVVGMTILHAILTIDRLHAEGDILDPDEGRVYRCKLRLVDGTGRLEVRGFIGVSLFGRTQVWRRQS